MAWILLRIASVLLYSITRKEKALLLEDSYTCRRHEKVISKRTTPPNVVQNIITEV